VNDYSHIPSNFTFAFIDNLVIDDLRIMDYDKSGLYERHMIWAYNVKDVTIQGFTNKLSTPNEKLSQIHFKDAANIEINSSKPVKTNSPFLFLEGNEIKNVTLLNNNFYELDKIVEYDKEFNKTELKEFNNFKK
jgi:hypothetical protein